MKKLQLFTRRRLAIVVYGVAEDIDMYISRHARVPHSRCTWKCRVGARVADALRNLGNRIWK